ncbi:hypothetical protein FKP32DRAFT_1671824 [Trametes sanguinea]|nr:hypothetical protein FKP32DRAFT_1671824 [Trametes sanguinea]
MAALPVNNQLQGHPNWVDPRGRFIGSTGMLFANQTAADIYFRQYVDADPNIPNLRVAVICVSWGMSMIYIQQNFAWLGLPAPPNPDDGWLPIPFAVPVLNVQDHGIFPPEGANNVPLNVQAVQAGAAGNHLINGLPIPGHRLPWHH